MKNSNTGISRSLYHAINKPFIWYMGSSKIIDNIVGHHGSSYYYRLNIDLSSDKFRMDTQFPSFHHN